MGNFVYFLFGSIPVAAIVFFVVSLIRYRSAKKLNMQASDTYSEEQMKSRRNLMITSSVIAGILVAVVIAFACLMFMAVAYM